MARIQQTSNKTLRIDKWLGLNEAPEGDTRLKLGEAAVCDNWKITADGSLRKRAGTKTIQGYRIGAMWSGTVQGVEVLVVTNDYNGYKELWSVYRDDNTQGWNHSVIGSVDSIDKVGFFPFGGNLYILDGDDYYCWTGTGNITAVEGYRPIVSITVPPAGGGETLEQINKLNGCRRCWFSPDGSSVTYQLPETGLQSVDWVKDRTTGDTIPTTDYTVSLNDGTVTFTTAPAVGVDTIEIAWTVATNYRAQVTGNHYAELYNGSTDSRIFLYGNGTNKTIYSGVAQETGEARADYFPDQNEVAVGEENEPITGLIRHYSRLVVFKPHSTWVIAHSTTTLTDGTVTAVFYLTPVNRSLGNQPLGQVQLVLNSARSLCDGAVYEWKNNSSYTSNLTIDERQAKVLSKRVRDTLASFNMENCVCWDDNREQVYYICCDDRIVAHNYGVDAWYTLRGVAVTAMCRYGGELFIGTANGLRHVSEQYAADYYYEDGVLTPHDITAYYESGSMGFSAENIRKYMAEIWVSSLPLDNGSFRITARTDLNVTHTQTVTPVSGGQNLDFTALDFANMFFGTTAIYKIIRSRLRARRFAYLKLIFESTEGNASLLSVIFNISTGGKEL